MKTLEDLKRVLKQYGEKLSYYEWSYAFDDWDAPLLEVRLEYGKRLVPVLQVDVNVWNDECMITYEEDGMMAETGIEDLMSLDELISAIINLEEQ